MLRHVSVSHHMITQRRKREYTNAGPWATSTKWDSTYEALKSCTTEHYVLTSIFPLLDTITFCIHVMFMAHNKPATVQFFVIAKTPISTHTHIHRPPTGLQPPNVDNNGAQPPPQYYLYVKLLSKNRRKQLRTIKFAVVEIMKFFNLKSRCLYAYTRGEQMKVKPEKSEKVGC